MAYGSSNGAYREEAYCSAIGQIVLCWSFLERLLSNSYELLARGRQQRWPEREISLSDSKPVDSQVHPPLDGPVSQLRSWFELSRECLGDDRLHIQVLEDVYPVLEQFIEQRNQILLGNWISWPDRSWTLVHTLGHPLPFQEIAVEQLIHLGVQMKEMRPMLESLNRRIVERVASEASDLHQGSGFF